MPSPTLAQLRYLRDLAERAGESFATPRSRAEASREIARLRARRPSSAGERRLELREVRRALAERPDDAAAVREHELSGYGATASWSRSAAEQAGPRVVHCRRERYDVYVGRGRDSKWGNPFREGADGDREQVIAKYRSWLLRNPERLDSLQELRGRTLGCWCAPSPCHADVLLELANLPRARQRELAARARAEAQPSVAGVQARSQETPPPAKPRRAARIVGRLAEGARTGPRPQLLARYTAGQADRVLIAVPERAEGRFALADLPAAALARGSDGLLRVSGRLADRSAGRYLLERALPEREVAPLIADYLAQAQRHARVPMAYALGGAYVGPPTPPIAHAPAQPSAYERARARQDERLAARARFRRARDEARLRPSRARARGAALQALGTS